MKMRPTVNLNESLTANPSAQTAQYIGHPSRFPKEQISDTRNAQTAYKTQNAAHSSTYEPSVSSQNRHPPNRERHANSTEEDQRSAPRNPEKVEQKHVSVDTYDIDSPRRYQSGITDEKACASCCTKSYLWCVELRRRRRECSEQIVGRPTRRFLERMKKRSKECERHDEARDGSVLAAAHREPIIRRAAKEAKRDRKQDESVDVVADVAVDARRDRTESKERRKQERDERERREKKKRKKERMKRHEQEEKVPYSMEELDEDRAVDDRVVPRKPLLLPPPAPPAPPLSTDFTKTCCYLCAQNTLAIASVTTKPEQSDKGVQVSAHKLRAETSPGVDKSCSPLLLVRTVQSSVKVRTRETSTLCPAANELRLKETRTKKRKKFGIFSGLTRTKCPAGRHAACETDKTIVRRDDNAGKREPRNGGCCREKDA